MMNSAREFIADFAEAISMPEVYYELRALFSKVEATVADYADIIRHDGILSEQVKLLSDYQFSKHSRKSHNLQQAISAMGAAQLHDTVLVSLCIRAFYTLPNSIIDHRSFWQCGINCGIASRLIAEHISLDVPYRFFTLGTLHEIGHALLYAKCPKLSLDILEQAQKKQQPIHEIERNMMGFDYGQLGCEVMKLWGLPKINQEVAEFHMRPHDASEVYRSEVNIVHLAHNICQGFYEDQGMNIISMEKKFKTKPTKNFFPEKISELILKKTIADVENFLDILLPLDSGIEKKINRYDGR